MNLKQHRLFHVAFPGLLLMTLAACGGDSGYGGGGGGGATYTVGGTVSGITGSGLVLRNNGGDDLPVSASGMFTFATTVANGAAYDVTVYTQPANPTQACVVTNASGTIGSSNVTNVAVACPTPPSNDSVIHTFIGGAEGTSPYDGVISDAAGNLYGTTWAGGDLTGFSAGEGYGTVFMVDASGNLLTLHTFAGPPTDGAGPSGPLTRDAAGNLYGTTSSGGNGADPAGYGTVFKLDAAGNETVLHHFTGGEGGFEPAGGVLRDSNGNLYGVTASGGLPCPNPDGCGTVFRLEPDGTFTTLHRFAADGAEGTRPSSGLIADAAGNLYGVTSGWPFGGNGRDNGRGIVFRIDSAGVFTMLYDFATDSVAAHPMGPLMRDDAGNLYGVTATGGDEDGGTIFKLDPEGEISILHEFGRTDPTGWWIVSDDPGGTFPLAGLVGDPAGIVYGTTRSGGNPHRGIVYRFDLQSRVLDVLLTFTNEQGGSVEAPLLRDSTGVLYGTTPGGGDLACNPPGGCGTVFRLDVEAVDKTTTINLIDDTDPEGTESFRPSLSSPTGGALLAASAASAAGQCGQCGQCGHYDH